MLCVMNDSHTYTVALDGKALDSVSCDSGLLTISLEIKDNEKHTVTVNKI